MPNDPLTITVHYKREHFEAIYFPHGRNSLVNNRRIRPLLLIIIVLMLSYAFCKTQYVNDDGWAVGIVMSMAAMVIVGIWICILLVVYLRWRFAVEQFLKKSHDATDIISCNDSFISMRSGKETVVIRWELLQQVNVTPAYITFVADKKMYLLPRASTVNNDFQMISDFILTRLGVETGPP